MNIKNFLFLIISCVFINMDASVKLKLFTPKNIVETNKSFDEIIGAAVSGTTGENISNYMIKQERVFSSVRNATLKRIRSGEVLEITIPSEYIFQSNDTILGEMSDRKSVV